MLSIFKRRRSKIDSVSHVNSELSTNGKSYGKVSSRLRKIGGSSGGGSGKKRGSTTMESIAAESGDLSTASLIKGGINGAAEPKNILPAPPPPDPQVDPVGYLRTLNAVRERTAMVMDRAMRNELLHFDVDIEKMDQTVKWVLGIIKRDYAPDFSKIPPHGRWQHFDVGGHPRVDELLKSWPATQVDTLERTRRLIDLFVVSVLLDAGAGTVWHYKSKESGKTYNRSEGLAVASLEMFMAGAFSSDVEGKPTQVDAEALKRLSVDSVGRGLQVCQSNPIEGLEGRTGLLQRLGEACMNEEFFGKTHRPGNMIDYLMAHTTTQAAGNPIIQLPTLWHVLMVGLGPIWPSSRVKVNGQAIGDAWPCKAMPMSSDPENWQSIVPFHKLTQWLAYSLMQPITRLLGAVFTHVDLMTGLPEYRNGGLLMDTGLLTLKPADVARGEAAFRDNAVKKAQQAQEVTPSFTPDDDVVVEWRALTVQFLDRIHKEVNNRLKGEGFAGNLSLAQVLEAGTWKGGREIAEVSRPNTKCPPIIIISDGTVF